MSVQFCDLSLIIVSWNTRDLLDACLASVYAGSGSLALEIFVVDNASSDGTTDMVAEKYPQVRLIRNTNNPGFAAANNQAIAQAAGECVLLLNPDTLVLEDALSRLVQYLRAHPAVGAVAPQVLNPDGSPQPSWNNAFPGIFNEVFAGFVPGWLHPRRTVAVDRARIAEETGRTFPTGWLGGVCLMVRQSVIAQVGLMDDGYHMYSEETDWCFRMKKTDWERHHVGDARIIHYGGQSSKQVNLPMFFELHKSKYRYFRKHHGFLYAAAYKILLLGGAALRFLIYRGRHSNEAERYRYIMRRLLAG